MKRSLLKTSLKRSGAAFLYHSGLLWLMARRRLRKKAVVLMYHRVMPENEAQCSFSHPGIVVTPESFARHLDFLKRHFRPLTLSRFRECMESGNGFPPRACLITFDDGWADNHRYALPLLRERGIPAVVFAATDYIGSTRVFWQEELGHLLYETMRNGASTPALEFRGIHFARSTDDGRIREEVAAVVDRYRQEPYENIQSLVSELSDALRANVCEEATRPRDRFMDWSQLSELAENGIDVASHTCSHRILTRLDRTSVRGELSESRRLLEDQLGAPVQALAYPNGDFDRSVEAAAAESGYRLAFTTQPGFVHVHGSPLTLPRVNIHESAGCTTPLFLCRILGLM